VQNFVLDYFVILLTYLPTHWLYGLLRPLNSFVTDCLLILTYIVFRCEDIFTPNPHPPGPVAVLCPAWELEADTYLLKIAAPTKQGSAHHWKFPECTPVRDLHTAFNLPYVYGYVRKLCRRQTEAIQNHENAHVLGIGQDEARHRKYRGINLAVVKLTTVQVIKLPL
jgi:hypothetical protein